MFNYNSLVVNIENHNRNLPIPFISYESNKILEIRPNKFIFVLNNDVLCISELVRKENKTSLTLVEFEDSIYEDHNNARDVYLRSNLLNIFNDGNIFKSDDMTHDVVVAHDVLIYKDYKYAVKKSYNTDICLAYIDDNEEKLYNTLETVFQRGQEYDCLVLNDFGTSYGHSSEYVIDTINELIIEYPIPLIVICITNLDNYQLFNRGIKR